MPTSQEAEILRKKAAQSSRTAVGLEATSGSIGDILMEGVRKERATRGVSKIATDTGNVMGQMASEPERMREFGSSEGFTMDPLKVDEATAGKRVQNLRTLGTISTQADENEGTLQEVIQAGANQLMGLAKNKMAEAQQYESEANAMYEKLGYEMDVRKQDFAEYLAKEKLAQSGKGGSGTRSGDMKSFAEDASGFQQFINDGSMTYAEAVEKIKLVYPWATEEDIRSAMGELDTNPELRQELYAKGQAFKQPGETGSFIKGVGKVANWLGNTFKGAYPGRK